MGDVRMTKWEWAIVAATGLALYMWKRAEAADVRAFQTDVDDERDLMQSPRPLSHVPHTAGWLR